jgi:nucleoside-diphosphate-sugar epimerase
MSGSNTRLVILRAPLVFGPGNPGNMERLLKLIYKRFVLPFGAIDNSRSFLFIDNLVDAIVTTLTHPKTIEGTYFVDDGTRFSTPELCRALASAAGYEARIARVPLIFLRLAARAGDLYEWVVRRASPIDSYSVNRLIESLAVDGASFRRVAKWRPPVGPRDAIRRTVECVTIEESY